MGTIKHAKTSTVPAPIDLLRINGPDWNEEHEFDLAISDIDGLTEALIPAEQAAEYRDQALAAAVAAGEARIGAEEARDEAIDVLDESVKTVDLAATTGATMVGTPTGTLQEVLDDLATRPTAAAIAAAYVNKSTLRVNIASFGGDPALADNTAAVDAGLAALGALTTHGGALEFGPGRWKLMTSRAVPRKVTVYGAGLDATIFEPLNAGTIWVTDLTALTPVAGSPEANVGFYDFQIDCVNMANVVGIALTHCRATICQNLKFRGCSTNILIDRGRNHSIDTIFSQGTTTLKCGGFVFTSNDDADYIFETHVRNIFFFNNYVTGVAQSLFYIRRAALLTLSDATINDGYQGNVTATTPIILENDCQGCKISNCVFAACSTGLVMQVGAGVGAAPTYCTINNVDIDQARSAGMVIESGAWNTFNNCKISSSGILTTNIALVVRAGAQGNVFSFCNFQGYNGVGGAGVYAENSSDTILQSCIFGQCESGVIFGANVLRASVHSNMFVGVTVPINGTVGQAGNSIKNNIGHRLDTNLAPAVPASNTNVTNNTGYAVSAHIVTGTVTDVAVAGVSTNRTGGEFRVEPGQTIKIVYTVAPQWVWLPSWG